MKTSVTRDFVRDVLQANGGEVSEASAHRLRVKADKSLAERLAASELSLAFNVRGLQEDNTSELATVGNPVFDRILEIAAESGRLGVRYASAENLEALEGIDPGSEFELEAGASFGEPIPVYTPLYAHVFRVESSIEEAADILEIVHIDGVREVALPNRPDLLERWTELDATAAPGLQIPATLPVPESVLGVAVETVEKRLRKRVAKLKRTAEARLKEETDSIGEYYQSLIEETRTANRRWAGGPEARQEKIRVLQLDWKRRISEATQFWMPKFKVSLAAVGVLQTPRLAFELASKGKRRRAALAKGKRIQDISAVYLSPSEDEFLVPPSLESIKRRTP